MSPSFQEFPRSYRWSQGGIGAALVVLALGGFLFRVCPNNVRTGVMVCLCVLVTGCLLISHYVIIRYPYISLVEPADGDPFSKHFASAGSPLYLTIKIIGIVVPALIATGAVFAGLKNGNSILILVYCVALTLFMVFFTFFYNPVRHPTVTTFVRSTLGLGIPLYPLYALTIAIGAMRCQKLLDSQGRDL